MPMLPDPSIGSIATSNSPSGSSAITSSDSSDNTRATETSRSASIR